MAFPRQIKDIVYNLLQEPTLDNFRVFMQAQTGEHNAIDFKEEWPEKSKLAKEVLSIANTGGGIIVFGIKENEDKSFLPSGLQEIKDKVIISNDIKAYISSEIKYEVYDFAYTASEYPALENKKFQMLVIDDCPEFLPFISLKEGKDIKVDVIYVRRGTACEAANGSELRQIIDRRINYTYPNNGQPLDLDEHLEQLKTLYNHIDESNKKFIWGDQFAGIASALEKMVVSSSSRYEEVPNPLYPEENYDAYIARIISEKKKKIERLLDLK